jgi:trigger factor
MKSSWQLNEKSTGVLKVTVEQEAWAKLQEKAFAKLAKDVVVDGFRKGSAPKELVAKQIGEGSVFNEAIEMVANDAYQFGVKEHDLNPVGQASLDISELTTETVTLDYTVPVEPTVTLSDYKSIKVAKPAIEVTDADVSEAMDKLRNEQAELVISEEAASLGDTVVVDFEGFKDDVAFEGGKGENYPLELGSNSFIPGFEEQLVGASKDQELSLDVTFPEDYGVEDLAGSPVNFKVKVHEVKKRELPELDDEFVKELAKENIETLDQLNEFLMADLAHTKEHEAEHTFEEELLSKVVDPSEVEIPDVMVEEETGHMFEDFKQRLEQQNYTLELYSQLTGQDEAYLKDQLSKDALKKIKLRLVLDAIAKEEKFEATDEQLEEEYALIAKNYNLEIDQTKQIIHKEVVLKEWKLKAALEYLKENAQQ